MRFAKGWANGVATVAAATPAAGRRPRWFRRRTHLAAASALTLAAGLITADRGAVWIATRGIDNRLAAVSGDAAGADASVGGVPFLTQVAGGKYDDLSAHIASIDASGIRLRDVDMRLQGVHVGIVPAILGRVRDVPIDRVEGSATLRYTDIQAALRRWSGGLALVRITGDAGGMRVSLPLAAAFGIPAAVDVHAVVQDGRLHLRVPGDAAAGLGGLLDTVAIPLPALPYGLRLADTSYGPTGLRFAITGTDAVLRAG